MKMQRLYSYVRQAMQDYQMIDKGDRVAIGISGGKDSLTLLYALNGLRKFYPKPFELLAITVDLGYDDFPLDGIQELCRELSVEYHVVSTQIKDYIAAYEGEKSHCSLCARLRKGALNDAAKHLGCNKIAYAHHMDDVLETMLLSLIYEGRFSSFLPVTHLTRTGLTVIRPMIYIPEADIIGFQNKYPLPVVKNPCPLDGHTRRESIRQLLRQIQLENPGAKKRMFTAVCSGIWNEDHNTNLR